MTSAAKCCCWSLFLCLFHRTQMKNCEKTVQALITLKLKSEDGNHIYVMKMSPSETVGQLRAYLDIHRYKKLPCMQTPDVCKGFNSPCHVAFWVFSALQGSRSAWLWHLQCISTLQLQRWWLHTAVMWTFIKCDSAAASQGTKQAVNTKEFELLFDFLDPKNIWNNKCYIRQCFNINADDG